MGEQVVRDPAGNVLGRIRRLGDGRYELRDRAGNLLGSYDETRDRTLDQLGNLVGYGNRPPSLLPKR